MKNVKRIKHKLFEHDGACAIGMLYKWSGLPEDLACQEYFKCAASSRFLLGMMKWIELVNDSGDDVYLNSLLEYYGFPFRLREDQTWEIVENNKPVINYLLNKKELVSNDR